MRITSVAVGRKSGRLDRRRALWGYFFILPWIIGFLWFKLYPFLNSIYLSFTSSDMMTPPRFIGLNNFRRLFLDDAVAVKSITNTLYYVALYVPLSTILALALALLMKSRVRGIGIFRTAIYLPAMTSVVATSVIWRWIFTDEMGVLNYFLGDILGLDPPSWLTDPAITKLTLIIVVLWMVGATAVIYLTGLQNIPEEYEEAALVDGANVFQRFFRITLPMLSPILFYNMLMAIIYGLQVFSEAYIITNGGPVNSTTFVVLYMYQQAFKFLQMGYASAIGIVLFVAILLVTMLFVRFSDSWVHYENN